jgi:hypothetical protein
MKKKTIDFFKRIMGYLIPKIQLYTQNIPDHKKTGCIVHIKMENFYTLIDEKKINKAVRGKIKGTVYYSSCACEPDSSRSFLLTDESDLEPFSVAMKTIDGVLEINRGQSSGQKLLTKLCDILAEPKAQSALAV